MSFFNRFLVLMAVSAALPLSAAHAYLDAASVSIAIQAVVGLFAAYIVTGKAYLQKVKNLFSRNKVESGPSDAAE
jgi:ABC-type phosphate transport system auxiliary subunit